MLFNCDVTYLCVSLLGIDYANNSYRVWLNDMMILNDINDVFYSL